MSKPARNTRGAAGFKQRSLPRAAYCGERKDRYKTPVKTGDVGAKVNLSSATLSRVPTSALNSY